MFTHFIPNYMALNFHWNKKRWELWQICLLYCHGPFKNYIHKIWNFITKLWVQIHLKELVKLFYKKIMSFFLFLVIFLCEFFLNEIFCNLLLQIRVVAYYITSFVLRIVE
jgi:hypothetical protein